MSILSIFQPKDFSPANNERLWSFHDLTKLTAEPLIIYILSVGLLWWLVAIILVITFPSSEYIKAPRYHSVHINN
ncbi:MAG: hypothetical protein ACTS8Y_02630, partial [Arsenophonus sp. ER-EMS1-MAG3]